MGGNRAISDLWDTFEKDYPKEYYETASIIEKNPDWYERVYDITVLGKTNYLAKEAAKLAHSKLHKT